MAVTEPQRLDLHAAARTALGPEEGDTLMASLPPANTDIATRQDVERVETSLRKDLERLAVATKQDLERLAVDTKQDLERLAVATKQDLERLAVDTKQDLGRVETSLQKDIASGIAASEGRLKSYVWRVALGTSVILGLTIVSLTIGGMAVLLQVLDVI